MEIGIESMEEDASIAKQQQSGRPAKIPVKKKQKTTPTVAQNREKQSVNETFPADASAEEDRNDAAPLETTAVSLFDYSVENHFRAMDTISELCREPVFELDQSEFQRLSSSITFIREWRQFCYKPRIVRFACRSVTPQGKDVSDGIHLPQFSSAAVPKKDRPNGTNIAPKMSKDFVMYVGGSVWAMDWCPNAHQISECDIRNEFIAVAAHPPESSYHKIGTPLTGRGMIQIWCLLNVGVQVEDMPDQVQKKPKTNSRSAKSENLGTTQPKKPRGRPRKKPIDEFVHSLDGSSETVEALAVQMPEDPLDSHGEVADKNTHRKQNNAKEGVSAEEQQIPDAEIMNVISSQPRKPRGREIKKPINETVDNVDGSDQYVKPLAVQFPADSCSTLLADGISLDKPEHVGSKDTCRNWNVREEESAELEQNLRGTAAINVRSSETQKLKGRSKKNLVDKSADRFDHSNQCLLVPSVQLPGDESKLLPADELSTDTHEEIVNIDCSRKRKGSDHGLSEDLVASKPRKMKDKARTKYDFHDFALPHMTQNGDMSLVNPEASSNSGCDPVGSSENITGTGSVEINPTRYPIPKDVALPRVVLCLAHNGKVAWDVKWRPSGSYAKSKHRMGYLAVLLGNGALEVWDIPLPCATKIIYAACQKEGNDPRFVKLEPVFRCSMLKYGGRKSIPLTVEWSASAPHDLILAGCHDGVVALWKFSSTDPCKDTRPLLCFSADTAPIRALAWAPTESDPESANVIVTAGHKGLKFWDIRDPFRPLWDLNPVQRVIYSLDWLPDPSCIILSFDDGTLRILSLSKAANDVPVTGKPFVGTQQQGLHSYYCSSFTIWSVQVSRLTGMVAYCSADGTVLRFQLTTRAVEKDPMRNRAPHFLCGSLIEEESAFTVVSPLLDTPFPMKKSLNEWANAPRTIRGFLSVSNQEKRAKNELTAKHKKSEESPLALCYGDETEVEFGPDDALMIPKSTQKPKAKSSSKKKLEADQALTCRERDQDGMLKEEESVKGVTGKENEIEELPPKTVAMHRVRWNMNKGSERWLCYGGAGGIVRCQEINLSCS